MTVAVNLIIMPKKTENKMRDNEENNTFTLVKEIKFSGNDKMIITMQEKGSYQLVEHKLNTVFHSAYTTRSIGAKKI